MLQYNLIQSLSINITFHHLLTNIKPISVINTCSAYLAKLGESRSDFMSCNTLFQKGGSFVKQNSWTFNQIILLIKLSHLSFTSVYWHLLPWCSYGAILLKFHSCTVHISYSHASRRQSTSFSMPVVAISELLQLNILKHCNTICFLPLFNGFRLLCLSTADV